MSDATTGADDGPGGAGGVGGVGGAERLERPVGFPWRVQRWVLVAVLALLGVQVLVAALTDAPLRPGFLLVQVLPLVLTAPLVRVLHRRPQVVDRDGIAPGGFFRRIPWADVDHVRRPTRWEPYVVLVLRDGRERTLAFKGEDRARDVARIGGVPVRD